MGYDVERIYDEYEDRDSRPIIPLRETVGVKRGDHKPPVCEDGEWEFAGRMPTRPVQVALPDGRVPACKPLDRRRPAPSPRAAQVEAVEVPLSRPRRCGAGVRTAQE